jgi:hypothetical protein
MLSVVILSVVMLSVVAPSKVNVFRVIQFKIKLDYFDSQNVRSLISTVKMLK